MVVVEWQEREKIIVWKTIKIGFKKIQKRYDSIAYHHIPFIRADLIPFKVQNIISS